MTMQLLPDTGEKQGRILNAALSVFALYGFRRASMEDIARTAGMSRAALYQHFRNKEDILLHGVKAYFDLACADLARALSPGRPLHEALREACAAQAGGLAEALLDSPHGEELLSMKDGGAEEETRLGNDRIAAIWSGWLEAEAAADRLRLPAEGAAATARAIIAGQHGQKMAASGYRDYLARLAVFADLMARALEP
ncbi:transcriptional regulator, TetR family protein [Pseudooceanicola batsensis HTCC2597]|uniref:Transcriptional regulator, TetR family protein n=1 Tax=Pseudooceanicola batsensis (strain ATCC BAA-863 / DSM 15984 / KCTC 12145 / HTCC2597) TaxID=252305 RepID=A3U457_PSEBH|nr:TetR/AcrR family transcriptional regulator [Pseudooceanicola batsensis]EAQ01044.1 transcriptional regulator, TetR family protein [Pseudooceanicola batsensis HTCC2597]